MKKIILALCSIVLMSQMLTRYVNDVRAQVTSSSIATSSPIDDQDALDGDIICTYKDGNRRCENEYDTSMYGVITDSPAAAIEDTELENARLIITSGITTVRISTRNGNIDEGDFVTSSSLPGVGMKADSSGYVIGKALEGFESDNTEQIGRIQLLVNVHPSGGLSGSRGNLLRFIREGATVPVFSPVESLRYLLAIIIVIISFTLGMVYFGRASRAGIEAVGRNPLAKRVIQLTVVMNIVLTIVIVLVGLAIAYLILVL